MPVHVKTNTIGCSVQNLPVQKFAKPLNFCIIISKFARLLHLCSEHTMMSPSGSTPMRAVDVSTWLRSRSMIPILF